MPKMKTNSAAKKRFKLTASGKLKREKAYKSHILTKKSSKTKRNLRQSTTVNASDEGRIKKLLGIGWFKQSEIYNNWQKGYAGSPSAVLQKIIKGDLCQEQKTK